MKILVMLVVSVLVVALSASAHAGRPDDPPPVFDKRPYDEAKKAAEDGKKWFIVKATADWCMPCKQMDKTTWRDDKVVKWIEQNAVASVFDVDKETKLARQLGIRAMPTMIAFKDGKEFDRVVGYKSGEEFRAWLEGIARGEKSIEAERKRAAAPGDGDKVDVQARMGLARSLAQAGKFDEATTEYVWLWQHALEHEPSYYGVRLSFMAGEMARLAAEDEGAKRSFTKLRDEAGKAIEGDKVDMDDLTDWVTLNNVIGDPKATLAWYDKVKDQPRWKSMVKRVARDLKALLVAEKRWADIGRISDDPLGDLEQSHEIMKMTPQHDLPENLPEESRKQIEDMPKQMLRNDVRYVYAGLLAAGKEKEAEALAAKAREYDPSAAMVQALVSTALEASQPRQVHLEWLDKSGSADAKRLRDAVKAALDKAK